jgi:hypothetical protein
MLGVALAAVMGLAALLVGLLTGSEAPDDTAPPASDTVIGPASDAGVENIGVGLPPGATMTAREIFVHAQRGDLTALAGLALDGGTTFTASFGDGVATVPELVALWEQIGRDEVLRAMLALVALPDWYETAATDAAGQPVAILVTPRFMHEPTAANRAVLEQRLGAAEVEASLADGQWLGWRLGITAEGDWQFFVTGD